MRIGWRDFSGLLLRFRSLYLFIIRGKENEGFWGKVLGGRVDMEILGKYS